MDIIRNVEKQKQTTGKIDIIELANSYGIKVYSTKQINCASYIVFDPIEEIYEIYVNDKEPGVRKRFSIAHEIAHYILHKDKIQTLGVVGRQNINSLSKQEEKDADSLGAKILMPPKASKCFLEKNNILQDDILDMNVIKKFADEFEVSIIAAAMRLRELGYYVGYIKM